MSQLSPAVLDASTRVLFDLPAPGETVSEGALAESLQRRSDVREDAYQHTLAARLAAIVEAARAARLAETAARPQATDPGRRGR